MNTETILDEFQGENSGRPSADTAASTGQRFANYLVDAIIFGVLSYAISAMLGMDDNTNIFVSLLLNWSIMIAYYTILEGSGGKSVGKMVTGTKVVKNDGSNPNMNDAFLRSLSRIVPFEFVSAFGSSKRMWHDEWTKTWVVKQ